MSDMDRELYTERRRDIKTTALNSGSVGYAVRIATNLAVVADGTNACVGVCEGVANGIAKVKQSGVAKTYLTNLVPGTMYYATTAGALTSTASADPYQRVGWAVDESHIMLDLELVEPGVWVLNQPFTMSGTPATLAAAATTTGYLDLRTRVRGRPVIGAYVLVSVAFGGSPDGNATVNLYGSVNDSTATDLATVADYTQTITLATSTTKLLGIPLVDSSPVPYWSVAVTNGDSADAIAVVVQYAYKLAPLSRVAA